MVPTGKRNNAQRLSMAAFFVFALCIIVTCWVATQYMAALLRYQPGLGVPVLVFKSGVKIYQPFSAWIWCFAWMHETGPLQDYVLRTQIVLAVGMLFSVGAGLYMWYRRSLRTQKIDALHGSARFANYDDVKKMNFVSYSSRGGWPTYKRHSYSASGMYLGAFDTPDGRKVIRYDEPAHVLVFAPSRSGKGVGIVIPTLLSYPHSVAVNDIKGENFELTSGFRHSAGSLVIRFDPTAVDERSIDGTTAARNSCGWNVCEEVRDWPYDVQDAQNIAVIIADTKDEGIGGDHWISTSWGLITGLILHCKYAERDTSLGGALTYLTDPGFEDSEQMLTGMLNAVHDPDGKFGWTNSDGSPTKTHPVVAKIARANLNREDKERASVLSTAETKLALFQDPIIAKNTRKSDFRIRDLMHHDCPVSLYLVVPPSDKKRLQPLLRMFFTYLYSVLTSRMEFADGQTLKSYKHRLLTLVDELISLGKMGHLEDALSYMAGYGITGLFIIQDKPQLTGTYGESETITSGCQVRVAFTPNTVETAEQISDMLGVTTIKKQVTNYSGRRFAATLDQMSVSEEDVERPLMTKGEVMEFPRDELLIFNAGFPAIRGKKLKYFEMKEFQRRSSIESPSRVEFTQRKNGQAKRHWMMVRCDAAANGAIDLKLLAYENFPAFSVVVKQESADGSEVITFPYRLERPDGRIHEGGVEVGEMDFRAVPTTGAHPDLQEYFEVHFVPAPVEGIEDQRVCGFGRRTSDHEREAREKVRAFYREMESRSGESTAIDLRFERAQADQRYGGTVIVATKQFIAIERANDRGAVSLHRVHRISRAASVGDRIALRYEGKKGIVA